MVLISLAFFESCYLFHPIDHDDKARTPLLVKSWNKGQVPIELQSVAECHRVSQSVTECHRVSQSVTECHRDERRTQDTNSGGSGGIAQKIAHDHALQTLANTGNALLNNLYCFWTNLEDYSLQKWGSGPPLPPPWVRHWRDRKSFISVTLCDTQRLNEK